MRFRRKSEICHTSLGVTLNVRDGSPRVIINGALNAPWILFCPRVTPEVKVTWQPRVDGVGANGEQKVQMRQGSRPSRNGAFRSARQG